MFCKARFSSHQCSWQDSFSWFINHCLMSELRPYTQTTSWSCRSLVQHAPVCTCLKAPGWNCTRMLTVTHIFFTLSVVKKSIISIQGPELHWRQLTKFRLCVLAAVPKKDTFMTDMKAKTTHNEVSPYSEFSLKANGKHVSMIFFCLFLHFIPQTVCHQVHS